jgi:hypothetical protein
LHDHLWSPTHIFLLLPSLSSLVFHHQRSAIELQWHLDVQWCTMLENIVMLTLLH